MKRSVGLICFMALMAGCSRGGATKSVSATTVVSPRNPVTLTAWVTWSGDDLVSLKNIIAGFERSHPGVTVDLAGGQRDVSKLLAAVNSGTGPDLANTGGSADLGKLCSTGGYIDLGPRLARDHIDESIFPLVARESTTFNGEHCAIPYITDTVGLYYNTTLLANAGFTRPPRTLSELTQMAEKLTVFNPDGSIKVAGFVPTTGFYENYVIRLAPLTGAPYLDSAGKASLTDPRWAELFKWQKSLVDFYGSEKLTKFAATAGNEFSASNGFETGKVAMVLDGEWRTGLLPKEHPELNYATAPMPVADDHPELYGSAEVDVSYLAVPKGAKHPDLAWELTKYLAIDTGHVVAFANALHNVPSTLASLDSKDLNLGPNFGPFLQAFANPRSSHPPALRQGPVFFDPITNFDERWQTGKVGDLQSELAKLNDQINTLVSQP